MNLMSTPYSSLANCSGSCGSNECNFCLIAKLEAQSAKLEAQSAKLEAQSEKQRKSDAEIARLKEELADLMISKLKPEAQSEKQAKSDAKIARLEKDLAGYPTFRELVKKIYFSGMKRAALLTLIPSMYRPRT